jgi:hypothetical protein
MPRSRVLAYLACHQDLENTKTKDVDQMRVLSAAMINTREAQYQGGHL